MTAHIQQVCAGNAPLFFAEQGGDVELVERDGHSYYRIRNYQTLPPFFMSVVSGFDHWLFVSSTGGLTCGRRSPDMALFPYTTDDKIHDASETAGPYSCVLVESDSETFVWEPFSRRASLYRVERNLYKSVEGDRLVFEELNEDLGLCFSYAWGTSERLGFVRRVNLRNDSNKNLKIRVIDGLRNILPWGVDRQMQANMSTLVDAYKQSESIPGVCAGVYSLSSIVSDRAEPSEALCASVAWSIGLEQPGVVLSEEQLTHFMAGQALVPEALKVGQRGAFFVFDQFELSDAQHQEWFVVADVSQSAAALSGLLGEIKNGMTGETISAELNAGTERLRQRVGAADGFQCSADSMRTGRHFSNVLFNLMRGGTFDRDCHLVVSDLLQFVGACNSTAQDRLASVLASETHIKLSDARRRVEAVADADIDRLLLDYLPLTFSRRHGDPSRPWNNFSIVVRNEDGSSRLDYQGNWRDIFQNWEALSLSYPCFVIGMISKFVNTSTVDGYNPYRISRLGFDWEVLDPDDPWSNIGYWGDHQLTYLQRLLDRSLDTRPGDLIDLLEREIFVYADVPYRLKSYASQLEDPRHTVMYDHERANLIHQRVQEVGRDGQLVHDSEGGLVRVNLLEKLLVPLLAKVSNLVPGGGIWMSTQRPEWNDANNALVGFGTSMVTLYQLRVYIQTLADIIGESGAEHFAVGEQTRWFFQRACEILRAHDDLLAAGAVPDASRKRFMDEMGRAAETWREALYDRSQDDRAHLDKHALIDFIRNLRKWLDHSIDLGRRDDGLCHAYYLLSFGDTGFGLEALDVMLEGQVALLESGYLSPKASRDLLSALRRSELYCEKHRSYLLYPDRGRTGFLSRNCVPRATLSEFPVIEAAVRDNRCRYLIRDSEGQVRFAGCYRNARELGEALEADRASKEEAQAVKALYERTFQHQKFTGRSGRMFKYEGLGCVYWHMVSKLALAAARVATQARLLECEDDLCDALYQSYVEIREGLGVHSSAREYGAFPTDPYSHSPGFSGVKQPGLTGQVKEDVLSRYLELGVHMDAGAVSFLPVLLSRDEFLVKAETWSFRLGDETRTEELQAGTLAFCLCGTPIIYRIAEDSGITVFDSAGGKHGLTGNELGVQWSSALFDRNRDIQKIVVNVRPEQLR